MLEAFSFFEVPAMWHWASFLDQYLEHEEVDYRTHHQETRATGVDYLDGQAQELHMVL